MMDNAAMTAMKGRAMKPKHRPWALAALWALGVALLAGRVPVVDAADVAAPAQPPAQGPGPAKITRPPAVPLVTHDPYLSGWSFSDHLYDDWAKHWTGRNSSMFGIVRVDGRALRFMGGPDAVREAVEQTGLRVTATRTEYDFAAGP